MHTQKMANTENISTQYESGLCEDHRCFNLTDVLFFDHNTMDIILTCMNLQKGNRTDVGRLECTQVSGRLRKNVIQLFCKQI